MAAYKRTQITVETDQVLIIRRRGCIRQWCRKCGRKTDMVSLAQARLITGMPHLLLDRIENGKWHVTEAQGKSPLICLDSLLAKDAHRNEADPSREQDS
jgi:hypothetical protein